MATTESNFLIDSYASRIGTPSTRDEVYGYWVFVLGLVFGVLGIALILVAEPETSLRGIGLGLAALALLLLLIGPIMRLPLRDLGRLVSYLGVVFGLIATLWLVTAFFQDNWSSTFENNEPIIIAIYGLGIVTMALGSVVVPLSTDTREEDERPVAKQDEEEETDYEAALEEAQQRVREAQRRAQQAEERAKEMVEERGRRRVLEAELHRIEDSQSQFELYTDAGGKHRWRLRHRNRNIIADSGQGYASKQKARQGLSAAKRDAFGATVVDLDRLDGADIEAVDDAVEGADAPEFVPEVESQATFETYRDGDGNHRWRLRHDNGGVIADSVQGYSSEGTRDDTIEYVRHYVQVADYLQIDPAAFELCRDRDGTYRWRLLHENGNVLADSTTRYETRREGRQAIEDFREALIETDSANTRVFQDRPDEGQVREAAATADTAVVGLLYQDNPNEWRLLLVYRDGSVIGESGEWYVSRENGQAALERMLDCVPEAAVLDIGTAAFEVYEDNSDTWHWRLRYRNGRVMADCDEGYESRADAEAGITSVKRNAPDAGVESVRR